MRVLHIGKFYPPHMGGIERYSADLCAAQAARGVEVAILAHASPGQGMTRRFNNAGVQVHLAACHGQLLYAPVSPSFPFLLARLLHEFSPDLLHLHVPNTSAFWPLLVPAARRLPWLVHWHADVPLDIRRPAVRAAYALYRPFEQAVLRHAGVIAATSRPYLDSSAALSPWLARTHVVPLGVGPLEKVESASTGVSSSAVHWPGDGLRVLAVGRLSYYKGFDVLLRAMPLAPETSLLLIGSGECDASLRALARELRIEDRVCFAGSIDDTGLADAYSRAQLFCLPSVERTEAFGVVLLEAMRARLPVIATKIAGSGVGHVVADGVTGTLIAPGNVAALASAIRRFADDAGMRRRFGDAGYARWQAEFTLDRSAEQMLGLYRLLVPASMHRAAAAPAASPTPARVEERDG